MTRLDRHALMEIPKGEPFKDAEGNFYLSLGKRQFWNPYLSRACWLHEGWTRFVTWYSSSKGELLKEFPLWEPGTRVRNAWGANGTIVFYHGENLIHLDVEDEPVAPEAMEEYMLTHGPFIKVSACHEVDEMVYRGGA